jgi:YVTN family beta-propeller protein
MQTETVQLPFGVSVTPDGKSAYVTNSDLFSSTPSNTVCVINTVTNTISSPITVGPSPIGVATIPNGMFAYVTNNSPNNVLGTVSVIN